jgi:hypothetical protein
MMRGAFSLKKRHATEWRLTEFPCDVTHAIPTKDFMRWKPATKIQNSVLQVEPTVPVVKPNGSSNGTHVAEKQRHGSCSGTVSPVSDDPRFHQKNTTSIPGTCPSLGEALPEWDINIQSVPSPGTQVTDYDLALGMASAHSMDSAE